MNTWMYPFERGLVLSHGFMLKIQKLRYSYNLIIADRNTLRASERVGEEKQKPFHHLLLQVKVILKNNLSVVFA